MFMGRGDVVVVVGVINEAGVGAGRREVGG